MKRSYRPRLGPLALRLTMAFLVVALAAVGVFAALTMMSARHEATGLSTRQRRNDLAATAAAAGAAYQRAGGWADADLFPSAALAARSQATLAVVDASGNVVAAPTDQLASMMAAMHGLAAVDTPRGEPVSAAVAVDGQNVGAVMLRFPTETMEAERHVRDALARTALTGTIVASAVAVIVALYVSIRVTRPVTALTTAAGEFAAGHRQIRVRTDGPGELATLADAFNNMADHLDREDQLRRNLVADVAHELRTPLTVLQGTTEALLDGIDEPSPEVLGSLNDEVTRLRRLVSDLEALAAAEAAGLRLETEPVDLADIAIASADLLRPLADDRHLTVTVHTSPAMVAGDRTRLQQIVVNLIANAIKFTPAAGSVTVHTEVRDGMAILHVSDTGPGIDEIDLPHVFERFWRGSNAGETSGSGIGLAIASELATAHHGELTAGWAPAGGTCFTLSIPQTTNPVG